jgi:hypothetical protein
MDADWYYLYGWLGAAIFRGLNCLPLRRGDIRGLRNPQLAELHSRLNGFGSDSTSHSRHNNRKVNRINGQREWCHIMVEGRVLQRKFKKHIYSHIQTCRFSNLSMQTKCINI